MTVPKYGRVTPLQLDVLQLGGEMLRRGGAAPATDDDRVEVMRQAHDRLVARTGKHFGFDLAAWHDFLRRDGKLSGEYTFVYAWKGVRRRVEQLLADPDRLRLVRLLEQRAPEGRG